MGRLYKRSVQTAVGERVFSVHTTFQIEKTIGAMSNKAQVNLFNLAPDSLAYVEKAAPKNKGSISDILCRIQAGYDGEFPLIFYGHVTNVFNTRTGSDIVTTVECGDGELQISGSNIVLTFKGGIDEAKIIQACIDRLKRLGLRQGFIAPLRAKLYKRGFSYAGRTTNLLAQLCSNQGLQLSVIDGAMQIIKKGGSTNEKAVLLSENSGLIGFPTKTNGLYQCRSLLNAEIFPGRQIFLKSKQLTLNGYIRASKVTHQGDSQEGDYVTVVEGKRIE